YWGNYNGNKISFAALNDAGGADLTITGTTVSQPQGVAIDAAAGKIYWAQYSHSKILVANLNGTGGCDLPTGTATVNNPAGLAIDATAGKLYWADAARISYANLNGTGAANLVTTGATVNSPAGVAIDTLAGRIYWASFGGGGKISFANRNGSGGRDLIIAPATTDGPSYPVLLEAPRPAAAPAITGKGSTLTCSTGSWAPDLVESFLYRAPRSFAYRWSRDGIPLTGVSGNVLKTSSAGEYQCEAAAVNQVGVAR